MALNVFQSFSQLTGPLGLSVRDAISVNIGIERVVRYVKSPRSCFDEWKRQNRVARHQSFIRIQDSLPLKLMATFEEKTEPKFLTDTYLFVDSAKYVTHEVKSDCEAGNEGHVILNSSIFYPQGGGQPSDVGKLVIDDGDETIEFHVTLVKANEKAQILHHGIDQGGFFAKLTSAANDTDLSIRCLVNEEKRMIHSRLHTAGHVLDVAMTNCGFDSTRLKPTKGYHFLDDPNVMYDIVVGGSGITPVELADLPALLTAEVRRLIEANIATIVEDMPKDEAQTKCGDPTTDLSLYPDMVRMVSIAGAYIPCGGTHLQSTSEIGMDFQVTKCKKKKQTVKVSYKI